MKIEDQCVSLEYAKRLKDLGVKQKDCLYFWDIETGKLCDLFYWNEIKPNGKGCGAFTVAELGEMLPAKFEFPCEEMVLCITKDDIYCVSYRDKYDNLGYQPYNLNWFHYDKKEADARAKMLIYLIENKMIEL